MADTKQSTRKSHVKAHTGIEIVENTELEWEEYRPLDGVTTDDEQVADDENNENEWESVFEDAQDEMGQWERMRSGCYTGMLDALNRNSLRRNECDGVPGSVAEGDKTAAALLAQLKRVEERKEQDRKTDRKQLNDKDRLGNAIPGRLVSVVKFKNLLENMRHAHGTLEELRPEAMHA
ncbi:hypothetical protein HDU77_003138 [Chytriomyces hyalinus]|nr:hypothetical protein HDU77_003138 [Chytriomyces hyalinus]